MKIFVGAGLLLFFFVFVNIIMMGALNTTRNISTAMFKTIYFVFLIVILGLIYIFGSSLLKSKLERALIIISMLIFSAAMATATGSLKSLNDNRYFAGGTARANDVQAQNEYYIQYVQSLTDFEESIKKDNRLLEKEVEVLSDKVNNRKPIIVETIVTIPGEIVYEQEPPVQVVVNKIYEDDERYEYEEED
jgi:glucan phosphoethanolaminetransferase (alkaline phosphatase superfamily)